MPIIAPQFGYRALKPKEQNPQSLHSAAPQRASTSRKTEPAPSSLDAGQTREKPRFWYPMDLPIPEENPVLAQHQQAPASSQRSQKADVTVLVRKSRKVQLPT